MSLHSPEFIKKKRTRVRILVGSTSALVLVVCGALVYFAHLDKFLISEVVVSGNTVTTDEDIERVARHELAGKYLWLIPRANSLIYSRGAVREALLDEIPRLSRVDLELVESRALEIRVTERRPYALYCEDVSRPDDPTGCYFLDEEGYIFSQAPAFSGEVYFLYARDVPLSTALGERFLATEDFYALTTYLEKLEKIGVGSRVLLHKPESEEYHLVLASGGKIIWNTEDSLDKIASDLEAFLSTEAIAEQADFLDKVQVIDLSIRNKVRWKLEN